MGVIGIDSLILFTVGIVSIALTLIFQRHIYHVDEKNIVNENELAAATEI